MLCAREQPSHFVAKNHVALKGMPKRLELNFFRVFLARSKLPFLGQSHPNE